MSYIKVCNADPEKCELALQLIGPLDFTVDYITIAGPHIMGLETVFTNMFPSWKGAFCLAMSPGGILEPHRDWETIVFNARYHIVLKNNPECYYYHDGDKQVLDRYGVYQMDPTKIHSAHNGGTDYRINLIIDV